MRHEDIKASMHLKEYIDYAIIQKDVLGLERALINEFHSKILLNKAPKFKSVYDFGKYKPIFEGIKFIIENNKN